MYYSRIYIHLMWATDNAQKSLIGLQKGLGNYLLEYAKKKEILCLGMSIQPSHIHCLVRMGSTQSVSNIVQLLKGRSSAWINEQEHLPYRFKWEDEYFAFSFDYRQLDKLQQYILDQNNYHLEKTYFQEREVYNQSFKLNYK